jgi:hypothetical protein
MSKTNHPERVRPREDLAPLQEIEDWSDLAEARETLAEIEKEGTISWERVKVDLKL